MRRGSPGTILATPPALGWPPDDTEESVVGTNLHQETITNLRLGLNEVASVLPPAGTPPPWQALSQTAISGLRRCDGTRYTVLPDVFVYQHPIDELRATLYLDQEGPPALIAEVLSPTTHEGDLDLVYGKGYSYAQAGVREYLVVDPTGEYVPKQLQGWRLEGSLYVPWHPEANGRWRSRETGAAIGFEGVRVVVHTGDGRRLPREGEVLRTVRALEAELRELRQRLGEGKRE